MEFLFSAFMGVWLLGPPALAGFWFAERWRSGRRNARGECASCGSVWAEAGSGEPFLIQGRLVCSDCAARAKRRLARHFSVLGVGAAIGAGIALAGADTLYLVAIPVLSVAGFSVGALQLMKWTNRRAQAEILSGSLELPDARRIGQ